MALSAALSTGPVQWALRETAWKWCSIRRGSLPTKYSPSSSIAAATTGWWAHRPASPLPTRSLSVYTRTSRQRPGQEALQAGYLHCGTGAYVSGRSASEPMVRIDPAGGKESATPVR